jgi:glycine cleavage system transcriptional repressor
MAIGADRPGILAALSGALFRSGANLEDISSTILGGYFASMLVAEAPPGTSAQDLERALAGAVRHMDVGVTVREVEDETVPRAQATHVLVAYAPDRPGIVATLSGILADRGANITDVSCRRVSEENPLYTFVAEFELPGGVDADELGSAVRKAAADLGADATLRPVEVEEL